MIEGEAAEDLGLEDDQIKELKKGLAKIQKQEEGLRKKLEAAGKEQAELLSAKGEIDEKAVMKAIEKTGKIRTQMAKLRIQPILLVKKTLTEEQVEKSHKMMRERMSKHREEWAKRRKEHEERRQKMQGDDDECDQVAPAKKKNRKNKKSRKKDNDESTDEE